MKQYKHDWSCEVLTARMNQKKRATLVLMKLYQRYMTLHSGNCSDSRGYRKTLIKRLEKVIPIANSPLRIIDGYLQ